jgi:glucan phosphoethanolaminetransferase (alkaline phosphatase superfamily)
MVGKNTKNIRDNHKNSRIWGLALSLIVLLPNIYLAANGTDIAVKASVYLGLSLLLFILPSLFLKARAFFLVQGIFVLLAPFEIAHIYLNKMPATSAFLLSIVDTEWHESTELLSSIKIPIVFLVILWLFYFYIALKKIRNAYSIRSRKIRAYLLGIFLLILFSGYSFYFFEGYNIRPRSENLRMTNEHVLVTFQKIYPYDLIIKTYQVFATKKRIKDGEEKMKNFKFEARKEDALNQKEVYVFVIGETSRYDSYSINGYKRETSPLLSKTENLISYSDFFSEANITSSSLSIILTRSSATDYNRSFVEKSFVDAFKEAGFHTYWIANQSGSNKFIRRISNDADKEYFTATNYEEDDNYDEKLWMFLDEVLKKEEEKVFIVFHTLGSHFRYNFRYPPHFEVFKPSLEGDFDYAMISSKNKDLFINTYDNSILYTDFFLAETIRKIDSLNAVSAFVYVSDHGENLFDTPENSVLHGGSKYTEYDFHVPFFIWTSEKYEAQYPIKTENILLNKDKKLSAGNIFYSWLDIANITFPEQILSKSIASDSLREDSVRYIINTNMEVCPLPVILNIE